MPSQVHPISRSLSSSPVKPLSLRGEAVLGGDGSKTTAADAGAAADPGSLSEFDILLGFLDTDGNGKVSALELADFVDSLLGTQDHKRPQGSIVFEAVMLTALKFAADEAAQADELARGPKPGQRPPPPPPLPPSMKPAAVKAEASSRVSSDGGKIGSADGPGAAPQDAGVMGGVGGCGVGPGLANAFSGSSSGALLIGQEAQAYASQQFLSMDAVRRCFGSLLTDTDLWIRLAGSHSVMTTALFRQLLLYSAGRSEKKFSLGTFVRMYGAFNTLPLWLPFPMLWRKRGHGVLLAVYLHQLAKLHQQLGPWLCARLHMHRTLVVLTMLQFTASYLPLIAFFAAHGVPAMWQVDSAVGWMQAAPLHKRISFFSSVLPWAVLQFLTSSGALKLSTRDFISLKDQCKAVFLLGDVATQFEGYLGVTVRAVMDNIKGRVEEAMLMSNFRRLNAAMPFIFSVCLELFRRLVRLFLVRNLVAVEPLAKIVMPFEIYGLVYNIWFAYSESADCTAYVFRLKKVSSAFKALLNKEEALSQSLPWLNNHSARNLLLWARLRRYYQCPNCLELRWIEMHLTLVVVAAVVVTIVLIVTLIQKQLLRFTPQNADLQLFVVWVIPAFIYLLCAVVIDVIMSASTGAEYHDGVMTLSQESVAIADRLNSAEEVEGAFLSSPLASPQPSDGDEDSDSEGAGVEGFPPPRQRALAKSSQPPGGRMRSSNPGTEMDVSCSGSGSIRRRAGAGAELGAPTFGGGGGAGGRVLSGGRSSRTARDSGDGHGGGSGRWRPAEHFRLSRKERARLRRCQDVIRSLVSYIQFNAEYITIFGVPIDTHLRNTLFSVAVTLVGAGVSAFLAIVIKR